jgi:hypothetical protein
MVGAPCSHLEAEGAEAGAGAMLVACRLADLSALGAHYAGIDDGTQSAARGSSSSQEASDANPRLRAKRGSRAS